MELVWYISTALCAYSKGKIEVTQQSIALTTLGRNSFRGMHDDFSVEERSEKRHNTQKREGKFMAKMQPWKTKEQKLLVLSSVPIGM